MLVTRTIVVEYEQWATLKAKALNENKTISELVRDMINNYLMP